MVARANQATAEGAKPGARQGSGQEGFARDARRGADSGEHRQRDQAGGAGGYLQEAGSEEEIVAMKRFTRRTYIEVWDFDFDISGDIGAPLKVTVGGRMQRGERLN